MLTRSGLSQSKGPCECKDEFEEDAEADDYGPRYDTGLDYEENYPGGSQ